MGDAGLARAALVNNLCNRLSESGDRAQACHRAREALDALPGHAALAAGPEGWLVLMALTGHACRPGSDEPFWPRPGDDDLVAMLLRHVPAQRPARSVMSLLTVTSWVIYILLRPPERGPTTRDQRARADRLQALGTSVASRVADREERLQWAGLTWELICTLIDIRLLDDALVVHTRQVELARIHPRDGALHVEVGKSATEVHEHLMKAGRRREALDVLRQSELALRSPEYLAARQADLGEDPQAFLDSLDRTLRKGRFRR